MTRVDRFLQRWRIAKAVPWLVGARRVLDIGCSRGELFDHLGPGLEEAVGLDPLLEAPMTSGGRRLLPGIFPDDLDAACVGFDAITMLAVLEHVPTAAQPRLAKECHRRLREGGRLVITVPSARVDRLLEVLLVLRLIDGMSLEQHHGFDPTSTPALFATAGFRLVHHRRFQLGLNHLFVLER